MDTHVLARTIAEELGLGEQQVQRTIDLLDGGNTIPFVARYRKEVTGSLDEEQLRTIEARKDYMRKLGERKHTVLGTIASQGKLTPELQRKIEAATVLQDVEDLYLPYKPKRRTRATMAREKGLTPLAEMILVQDKMRGTPADYAAQYLSDTVPTVEEALAGARDIVAEVVAEDAEERGQLRQYMLENAVLNSRVAKDAEDPQTKYAIYYEYAEKLSSMPPHRLLAVNRGEREGVLHVDIQVDDDRLIGSLQQRHLRRKASVFAAELMASIDDGYRRLLRPSIVREVRAEHTLRAETHAIRVFGANLRGLLLQSPLKSVRVLGVDPGYRTGCKVAAVDETGKYLASCTIFPHPPQRRWDEAKRLLAGLIQTTGAEGVAIGNGTASRETETLVAEMIAEASASGAPVHYVIVDEAGASVYSASKLAAGELPQLDVSMRGAVSIARRLQDPLAELVKIEPRSIGVGLYQHDVDQKELASALDAVVESAVNYVGVDVSTASVALLQYVAGLNSRVAEAVVEHRETHGRLLRRAELLKVKGLGPKTYEQAAGFLKISGGQNPLDNTFIHPESYEVCLRLLHLMGLDGHEPDLARRSQEAWLRLRREGYTIEKLASRLDVGVPTLEDILANLSKPGRDPREDLPAPILRTDVLKMEDLHEGMRLRGTVRNVVDFGAFVDIGLKQDGLVHISEMADRFVQAPLNVVNVGDVIEVSVIKVDTERGRIGLSMKR